MTGSTNKKKIKQLDNWLTTYTRYHYKTYYKIKDFWKNGKDPKGIRFTGYHALVKKSSVCNGFAEAVTAICEYNNIPCKYVRWARKKNGKITWEHAWNIVKIDGKWYHIDTTWDVCARKPYGYLFKGYKDNKFKNEHKLTAKFYKKYMKKSKFGASSL